MRRQLNPADLPRHRNVRHQRIEPIILRQKNNGLVPRTGNRHIEPGILQQLRHRHAEQRLVLDQQDLRVPTCGLLHPNTPQICPPD